MKVTMLVLALLLLAACGAALEPTPAPALATIAAEDQAVATAERATAQAATSVAATLTMAPADAPVPNPTRTPWVEGTQRAAEADVTIRESPARLAEVEGYRLAIERVEWSTALPADGSRPPEGHLFLLLAVRIENRGDEPLPYNRTFFSLQVDGAGEPLYPHPDAEPSLGVGSLLPGRGASGALLFVVPERASRLRLAYQPGTEAHQWPGVELELPVQER